MSWDPASIGLARNRRGIVPPAADPPPQRPLSGLGTLTPNPRQEPDYRAEPPGPMFTPFLGWEGGQPPWSLDEITNTTALWDHGAANYNQLDEGPYVSPYVNIPDQERVVEAEVDPWDIFGGIDALAPVVQRPDTPERAMHWQGPQPTAIPLGQQFESEARDWRGGNPPTVQEQRGRPKPVPRDLVLPSPAYGPPSDVYVRPQPPTTLVGMHGPRREPAAGGMRGGQPLRAEDMYAPLRERERWQTQQYNQPQQYDQSQQWGPQQYSPEHVEYAYRNLHFPRAPKGPTYQQLYYPQPGGVLGRTVWEEQNLIRPPGPLSWKDTRGYALGPEGGFDPNIVEQLENGEFSPYVIALASNIEAIDEGPRKAGESMTAWRARVVTTRKAIGIEASELRARPYSFPSTAKKIGDTPEQLKARLSARRRVKAQWEKDKEVHKNKMDHTHKNFDPEYATQYRAEKAARQWENAKSRKTALLIARRIAERDNLPRPTTPELPEDSSDEDLPAMPPRNRSGVSGGYGPVPKRCLYCKHMRKPCTLVTRSPRPCERCKARGIVCEVTRDLEDAKSTKPVWKLVPKGPAAPSDDNDEEEEDEEDEEPITAQEKASLSRKKRATFNQGSRRRNSPRQERRSASPSVDSLPSKQCEPCKDQSRPCDGELPCGTCRLNGTVDMCSAVSYFSKYRQRDYREGGGALPHADDERALNPDIDVEWDRLAATFGEADAAVKNMDLGPMMNHSSHVIMESMEAGHQNNFFLEHAINDHPAMQPYQPNPDGPSYNRVATVVEPDASYNSLAPEAPEFLAEPFGDVAHYAAMTFGGEGIDFGSAPEVEPHNSVERPDYPDAGLEGVLEGVEERRFGSEVIATLRRDQDPDSDPDPSLKGMPLSDYRREWKQDLKGILKNKNCDELIGVDICFKAPAKHCDYLQHGIEGGDWHTCVLCHTDQNLRVTDAQQTLIEYTKLYYCNECVSEQKPRTRSSQANAGFRKGYCTCTSQMRKSWLCNSHRDEAMSDVRERALAVKNWMTRRSILKCNGCDTRDLGERTEMWACSSCKDVVYA
ncbi:hypothetical protein EAF04_004738 [Stromatinia cepivora]|nr:hypothetical protein EAF04_004738 [Stromatinia cepivora]